MSSDNQSLHPDRLRYALGNPLAVIHGRVQMLQRHADRSPDLTEADRQRLQIHFIAIQAAVRELADKVDHLVTIIGDQSAKQPIPPNADSTQAH